MQADFPFDAPPRDRSCVFCDLRASDAVVMGNELAFALRDASPVSRRLASSRALFSARSPPSDPLLATSILRKTYPSARVVDVDLAAISSNSTPSVKRWRAIFSPKSRRFMSKAFGETALPPAKSPCGRRAVRLDAFLFASSTCR
jgi:hypothetical protein